MGKKSIQLLLDVLALIGPATVLRGFASRGVETNMRSGWSW
jgi:hypothetical protein